MNLTDSIDHAPFVGTKLRGLFNKLEIFTIDDLLHHYPSRYIDYSNLAPIADQPRDQEVTIQVVVETVGNQKTRRGLTITRAHFSDATGKVEAVWFNQPYISQTLKPGMLVNLSGVLSGDNLFPTMKSPEYEVVRENESVHTARIIPIYPETAGLSSKRLRSVISRVIAALSTSDLPADEAGVDIRASSGRSIKSMEFLPLDIRQKYNLIDLNTAIREVHFPSSPENRDSARHRLAFDELLLLQLKALIRKQEWQKKGGAFKIPNSEFLISKFIESLPYPLTGAQERCLEEILEDLTHETPMNRLLEGDVGSGKTVVAAAACLACIKAGQQAVIMAPTEILAQQHYQSLTQLLGPFKVNVDLHTAATKHLSKNVNLIIGTHALLFDSIKFKNVGMVVIDEQHRFGVNQRLKLIEKASGEYTPHVLSLTATPIPRTMALTIYGDLELSLLNETPPGRQRVKTHVVPEVKRQASEDWVRAQIAQDNAQVFVICPRIQPKTDNEQAPIEEEDVKAAETEFSRLQDIYPEFQVGLLHGQMSAQDKKRAIEDFAAGNLKILVSTSVVEVGIDIPDANIMIIQEAEHFGLAQLHQLRGRVGRGSKQSYCFLFAKEASNQAIERLRALENNHDGFALSELDLKLRGPGEIYGLKQSGIPQLKIATFTDAEIINQTRQAASEIIGNRDLYKNFRIWEIFMPTETKVGW